MCANEVQVGQFLLEWLFIWIVQVDLKCVTLSVHDVNLESFFVKECTDGKVFVASIGLVNVGDIFL